MDKIAKKYDLEERTYKFALDVRKALCTCSRVGLIQSDKVQAVRSAGSTGANYIEANESLSKKDFVYRVKICKKEVKETWYWLRLIRDVNENMAFLQELINESVELMNIFGSIINKVKL